MTAESEKACNACGAKIPYGADVCSVCKTYQRRWKARLQFSSSITALVVASISLAAWTLGQLPTLRAKLFPRTKIAVVSCNSLEGGVVANLGDETVFLSHIILFNTESKEWVAQRFPINQSLAPNSFLKVSSPWAEGFTGTFARGVSTQQLPALVNKAAGPDPSCVRMALFAQNDPMYREELAKAGGPTLTTLPAAGYLEYFSVRSPQQPFHLPVAAVGVLMTSSRAECMAK
jgi:ribosomal protein L40E